MPNYHVLGPTKSIISGTVAVGGTPVPGGVIELRNTAGTVIIDTKIPNGSGFYSFSVAAGSYKLYPHPPLGYSLDIGEVGAQSTLATDQIAVTVSGTPVTRDIALRQSVWDDNFSGYADSSALRHSSTGFSKSGIHEGSTTVLETFGPAWTGGPPGWPYGGDITLETTAGPAGGKVMRYSFPNRTAQACDTDPNFVVNRRPYWGTTGATGGLPAFSADYWFRWHEKLSSNWKNYNHLGSPGASCEASASYKHLLVNFGDNNNYERIGLFWNFIPPSLFTQVDDGQSRIFQQNPGPSVVGDEGAWVTYVVHISGLNSTSCKVEVFKNGVLTAWSATPTGTFKPNAAGEGNGSQQNDECRLKEVIWGFNINTGPSQAQTRDIAEVGVYKTRPSMVHGLAT